MMDDLLERTGSEVFTEGEGVDVELVLLRSLGLEADYVDLPDGVMGRTLFERDGSAQIQVSRRLADEAETDRVARRRLRTTQGHEVGHVACHQQLFIEDTETLSLFNNQSATEERPAILCRGETVGRLGYRGHWWEYQANQCMAELLLPCWLVRPRVKCVLQEHGVGSFEDAARKGIHEDLVRALADMFDVSWEAVVYRLQELGFLRNIEQSEFAL